MLQPIRLPFPVCPFATRLKTRYAWANGFKSNFIVVCLQRLWTVCVPEPVPVNYSSYFDFCNNCHRFNPNQDHPIIKKPPSDNSTWIFIHTYWNNHLHSPQSNEIVFIYSPHPNMPFLDRLLPNSPRCHPESHTIPKVLRCRLQYAAPINQAITKHKCK